MRKLIKRKLEKFVYDCVEKYNQQVFSVTNNPMMINFSTGARIRNPLKINGGKYIHLGNNSSIGRMSWVEAFDTYLEQRFKPEIIIGDNVGIGNFACITAIDSIRIGKNCLISEHVYISDHAHGIEANTNLPPALQNLNSKGPVELGENCFLGYRVSILPGVILGSNCVVGAHSVVTHSFPDYSMLVGVPARLIKSYSIELKQWVTV